ncbi:hypothetical protein [Streptomyces sp. NBC_00286]|uniref:hypothetical protein n=1 Tax=Streptomyces sp. NBC_00286 TaxID=2975701 RepID=UPI002E2B1D3E|nr:hypothetical protein [Streptomyces sp. NBC_00286]
MDDKASAGSSFALSQAVYAGEASACYGNGDFYEFTVLAAGGEPGEDSEPNGEKPDVTEGAKPQGDAKEITGNLAKTGSGSALPNGWDRRRGGRGSRCRRDVRRTPQEVRRPGVGRSTTPPQTERVRARRAQAPLPLGAVDRRGASGTNPVRDN